MNNLFKFLVSAVQKRLVSRINSSANGHKNGTIRLWDVVEAVVTLILAISCLILIKHLVDIWYEVFFDVLTPLT